uniref:IBR domain-containing protein n=1 Tax=Chromera velia CCMP2878 TaxID=1169474 RepID=A0A0G4HHQ6_9ALVE|eukprot:Cvel_27564.t1-p1 / transcript=Cvel_27564.t1 / gene=Cvel_27564 / organism=Chromera_velia_CCMP2878 / gene_product=hypothetical protein / transcript_product=hypothetical protein / location=Cvel_scaffold3462:13825-15958(+) / protein_length=193 / sequence_SO=supercontig / SO=protein_coding / is_pseudo=false
MTCLLCMSEVDDEFVRVCLSSAAPGQLLLGLYERWALAVGLSRLMDTGEAVLECPTPDCGFRYTLYEGDLSRKRDHEPPSAYSFRRFMWKPLELDGREGGGDARKFECPKCRAASCILCRAWWGVRAEEAHDGKSCVRFGNSLMDYDTVGRMQDCKQYPNAASLHDLVERGDDVGGTSEREIRRIREVAVRRA